MAPPNLSDPLPYRPVNNGNPPRIPLSDDLSGKGKKRDVIPVCFPKTQRQGLPPFDPESPYPRVSCTRNGMARLGKKIIK